MALSDLLSLSSDSHKIGLSEERVEAIIPIARDYISYWRDYPDMFIDFLAKNSNSTFKFYFYQRVFMRVAARHKYVYATYPRACENAPNRKNFFYFRGQTSLIKGTQFSYYIEPWESLGKFNLKE